MAKFGLLNTDATLVDYVGGQGYLAELPVSIALSSLVADLGQAGTQLEQANLRALVDSTVNNTTGTAPLIRLALDGLGDFSSAPEKHTLVFQFIRGTDATREAGETGVSLTLDVWFKTEVTAEGTTVTAYANTGPASATVYFTSSTLSLTLQFSASDTVATAYQGQGKTVLDLNFFGFMTRFAGLGLDQKLTEGNYHLNVTGLPLTFNQASVSTLSVAMPISAPANQAPQLQGNIADQALRANTPAVLTLSAPDPEQQAVTYHVVSGGSVETVQARIDGASLTLTPANGYTSTQPIEFTVKASDPNGAYTTDTFSVAVANVTTTVATAHYWNDSSKPIGNLNLSQGVPQKTTTVADRAAITLSDVLTTLKYYLGKTQLTGYAAQSADYNDDGTITLADVLATLKAYLGKSTPPVWEFDALSDTNPVEYVGILKGDVNGSWVPE